MTQISPALLALAVLVVAGCLDSASTRSAESGVEGEVLGALGALGFGAPILVGKGGDAETSLTVSADGRTILACSHGGFTKPSPFWASTDAGATFAPFDPQPNPIPSGDCDVAIASDGTWYMIYDTIASTSVAASSDKGASWRIVYAAAIPFGGVDRPWIQTVGTTVYLTYANVMVAEPAVNMFAISTDGGRTWTEQRIASVTDPPERTHNVMGHLFVSDEGRTIRIPLLRWSGFTDGPQYLEFATSRDAGATWGRERVLGPIQGPLQLPVATRAGDGTLYWSYAVGADAKADVMLVHSTDDGKSWSPPLLVSPGHSFPGLAAIWVDGRTDGSATLAWMHNPKNPNATGTLWQMTTARVNAHADVVVESLVPLFEPIAASQIYEFSMVRHDADGTAHYLYPMAAPGCKVTPATSPNSNRNQQCVHLAIEANAQADVSAVG